MILRIGAGSVWLLKAKFDENINEMIFYLTSGMRMAIIPDVDLHRCRRLLGGTSKQLNDIEAQRLSWSRFLMSKFALDKPKKSGKLLRLSSKGVVAK